MPALDGLRALAVVAVLLFHADLGWVGGGFLGVSVFFTLSGFLITSLLLAEHESTGTITLSAFFARRVRRLLPAAYACMVLVVVLGVWWGAVQRRNLPGDLVAAVFNVANWRFAFASTSYQDLFIGGPSPLAHFWSLAIEEQCYLALPLLAWWALRRGRKVFAAVLAALLVLSIVATLATRDSDLVYYGTHTRAAELLAGALLAYVLQRRTVPDRWREAAGWAGLVTLSVAVLATRIDDAWLYRGGLAAVSLPSMAVIIGLTGRTAIARVVGWAPLVAVGKVSYGLYLFHWPIFLVLTPERLGTGGVGLLAVRLTATVALTLVSYRLVEQPIRLRRAFTSPVVARRVMGAAAIALLTAAAVAIPAPRFTATEELLATGTQEVIEFPTELPAVPPGGAGFVAVVDQPPTLPRVLIVGSNATPLPALQFTGWDVVDGLQHGCPASGVRVAGTGEVAAANHCEPTAARWVRMVMASNPDVVVVSLGQDDAPAPPLADSAATPAALSEQARQLSAAARGLRQSLEVLLALRVPVVLFDAVPATAPFDSGLDKLALSMGVAGTVHRTADTLVAAVAGQLGGARLAPEVAAPLRLTVIGDSTSLGVAQALSEGSGGRLQVTWAGANGCPIVRAEAIRPSPRDPWTEVTCEPFDTKLPPLFAANPPDVVLLVVGPMELVEQRYPGDPDGHVAGDPEFIAFHDSEMAALLEVVRAVDAPLVVADSPTLSVGTWSSKEMVAPGRLAAWNAQVERWAAAWPDVTMLPYAQVIADHEAVHGSVRPDGVHPDIVVLTELARETLVDLVLSATTSG